MCVWCLSNYVYVCHCCAIVPCNTPVDISCAMASKTVALPKTKARNSSNCSMQPKMLSMLVESCVWMLRCELWRTVHNAAKKSPQYTFNNLNIKCAIHVVVHNIIHICICIGIGNGFGISSFMASNIKMPTCQATKLIGFRYKLPYRQIVIDCNWFASCLCAFIFALDPNASCFSAFAFVQLHPDRFKPENMHTNMQFASNHNNNNRYSIQYMCFHITSAGVKKKQTHTIQ